LPPKVDPEDWRNLVNAYFDEAIMRRDQARRPHALETQVQVCTFEMRRPPELHPVLTGHRL
jgi:hypothetical protein